VILGFRPSSLLGEEFLSAPIHSPLSGRLIGPPAAAVAMVAKMMGKKQALTAKLAPRRLMSSAESTVVGTFAFDVVIKTCKFMSCVPFSEQLFCKL
jgi:predicted membrane protein